MKQTALVIATLFATVEASDAKERLNRDIHGYLHEGLKFDTKVIKALHKNEVRVVKAQNEFHENVRQNLREGDQVMDKYEDAIAYESSQTTFTPPTAANGEWGNIHYNNPQKIMDKWMGAAEDHQDLGDKWGEDSENFGERINESHEILGDKINKAWENHGVKAQRFFESGVENAGQAWQEDKVNAPHTLAGINSMEVREDAHNFSEAVGAAHHAVRKTIRDEHRADAAPDRRIDHANYKYTKERLEIAKGYNKAIEYEIKNTHFERGAPGGEGGLSWSHKQKIVDKWAVPMEQSQEAHAQWKNTVNKNMMEKMEIHKAAMAEANKVWPAKFAAVEKSWKELAANFNDGPHSLASRAEIKAGLNKATRAGYELDKSVIDDFLTYNNDTVDQRKEFKSEVKSYVEQKKIINQEYAAAYNYEMQNIHFTENKGRWSFTVDNKETILDKWTTAQTNDIQAREELKEDWINYQNSIAAEKAAFKATAQAQWPKKFAAYKAAVIEFDQTMEGPQQRAAMTQPHTLITDVQQKEAELIRGQVYDNLNERAQFKFDVKHDLKSYLENTNGARQALQKDQAAWKAGSKRVQDMYAAAWNYQIAQTKFTPATNTKAAHFELENAVKVSNNYRSAAQADQDLGQEIKNDIMNYNKAIAPAQGALKNEINSQWVPQAEKINRSDVAIVEEVLNFPNAHAKKEFNAFHQDMHHMHANATAGINKPQFTHPYHNLMAVESSSTLSTNEQIAYGTVFLMAMIAVAALSNKGEAKSKTVEFDVEDLEMTNKKESKKQIKKTLKDIMKTSNTKVTLMNN